MTSLTEAQEYFEDWIGFKLTRGQFKEILDEEPSISNDIREMGPDTSNREAFMEALGKKITGLSWPQGNTSKKETEEFFRLMKVNGQKMGYKIPDDYEND